MIDKMYQELKCYIHMSEKNKEQFDILVDYYVPMMGNDSANNTTSTRFTLHDFEHHCYNLFKIVSEVLLSDSAYESSGLSDRELYVLNLAILFHDISLHKVTGCDRNKHARQSAEWVREEYNNSQTAFADKSGLLPNEVEALCAIIQAHSDEKGAEEATGIRSDKLKEYPAKRKRIRTKLLAGILRIADELDVTEQRIGDRRSETQLRKKFEEYEKARNQAENALEEVIRNAARSDMDRLKGDAESYKFWERLHCFSEVNRNNSCAVLYGNECWIDQEYDIGNESKVEQVITEIFEKITKEFIKIQKELFEPTEGNRSIIAIDKITVDGFEKYLKKRLEKDYQKLKDEIENSYSQDQGFKVNKLENKMILEQDISNLIEEKNLLVPGHFIVNNEFCARDWIKIQYIFENMDIYRKCIDTIVNGIKQLNHNNLLFVGLDLNGALMASTVGFILGIPFTYVIPIHKKKENSERDRRFINSPNDNIVFFTDAVSTFHSVDDVCRENSIKKNKVKAIYTILYRQTKGEDIAGNLAERYAKITYCINDKYPIELIERSKCERKDTERCLACNKQIGLGGIEYENN